MMKLADDRQTDAVWQHCAATRMLQSTNSRQLACLTRVGTQTGLTCLMRAETKAFMQAVFMSRDERCRQVHTCNSIDCRTWPKSSDIVPWARSAVPSD